MTTPALSRLQVVGPFWSAEVDVVTLDEPRRNLSLRRLFVDATPRRVAGTDQVLAPGTVLALGLARSAQVTPAPGAASTYRWQRAPATPPPPLRTFDEMRAAVRSGAASLLLLEADPAAWPAGGVDPPPFTCLAGEIALDPLAPQQDAGPRLYAALGLQEPGPAAVREPGRITLHTSGLSVLGSAALLWQGERVTAPFHLLRVLPPPGRDDAPAFRLTPEAERLTAAERAALIAAAQRLSGMLNPRHPLNRPPRPTAPAPRWATLEVVDPTAVPRLVRPIPAWGTLGALTFERGELALLLSDRPPYDTDRPPDSLARVLPEVEIAPATAGDGLVVTVRAGRAPELPAGGAAGDPPDPPDSLGYHYKAGGSERIGLRDVVTAFSPTETPRLLRIAQELPEPEWDDDGGVPLADPVVWGFAPLDDGWAQLPIPNLTEQIYLDAGLAQIDRRTTLAAAPEPASPAPEPVLQGAVSFANRHPDGSLARTDEHPWSVTVTGTAGLAGRWTLTGPPDQLALTAVDLIVAEPDLALTGFCWLSTEPATVADALPGFDNWVDGLRAVPLERVRTRTVADRLVAADLFPSLLVLRLRRLALDAPPAAPPPPGSPVSPDVRLGSWELELDLDNPTLARFEEAGPVFTTLAERLFAAQSPVLPAELFTRYEALVWRRHPALPFVQALPLTQSKEPPNEPSASRQLAPFALPTRAPNGMPIAGPAGWRLGVPVAADGPGSGASTWARLLGPDPLDPATEWRAQPDLPMVSLSLPGLQLGALAADDGLGVSLLPLRYRHDLPYTDEVQALAQPPKDRPRPEYLTSLPDAPVEPAPPLGRETYAAHWRGLSERAGLAAADAAQAFGTEGGQVVVRHLVEPWTWPVEPAVGLEVYPGRLTIADAGGGAALVLEGGTAADDGAGSRTPGASDAALRGISGVFAPADDEHLVLVTAPDDTAFVVEAGSMSAHRNADGSFRDQRGLSRGPTEERGQLLLTVVRLDGPPPDEDAPPDDGPPGVVALVSARTRWDLAIEPDHGWRLWFRDLPTRGGSFVRERATSRLAQDVNDPGALARGYNHLSGYEWRLADSDPPPGDTPMVRLCGLEFYPLTLQRLDVADGVVHRVEVVGRLQLPLSAQPTELTELGNAVRAVFVSDGSGLALTGLNLVSGVGEWPLALTRGELGGAARISWAGVHYEPATHTVELIGAELRFELFDAEWRVPLKPGSTRFTASDETVEPEAALPAADGSMVPVAATVTLDLAAAAAAVGGPAQPPPVPHRLAVDIGLRLGRTLPSPTGARAAFSATVRFTVLAPAPAAPRVLRAALFDDIVLRAEGGGPDALELLVHGQAMQFAWARWQQAPPGLQVFPGMPLGSASPGAVALTFAATATGGVPRLDLRLAFVEATLLARWGTFLQVDTPPATATPEQVYGSSAGDVAVGYTAHAVDRDGATTWAEEFLLNGFLEVKSLLSWPDGTSFDPATAVLRLPAAPADGALDHTRHSMRMLLNQHRVPSELVVLAADATVLFDLAPGQGWQTLAVVEHQLVAVRGAAELRLGADRRWTAIQEVRLLTPGALRGFLQRLDDPALRSLDPVAGLAPLGAAGEGYFVPELRAALLAELDRRAAHGPYLLVEASTPHWVRRTALEDVRPTTLQYLPGGSQHAIPSGPDDYPPAAPLTPAAEWLLLTTPLLGRVQPPAVDGIAADADPALTGPLAMDPVLALRRALDAPTRPPHTALALALTHRGDGAEVATAVALLDTAAGHTFARLDPATLAENWYRLQKPFPEPAPERLASVLATLPDTAARASRSVALRRAFDPFRPFVPPADMGEFRLSGDQAFRYQPPPEIAGAALVWRQRSLLAPGVLRPAGSAGGDMVAEGIQALYTFTEGSGNEVRDHSGVGAPLDLVIRRLSKVAWSAAGLTLREPTAVGSKERARKVIDACRATNEVTLEAWLGGSQQTESDLPRIVTISNDKTTRNVELVEERERDSDEQDLVRYVVRLRTSVAKDSGEQLETPWLPRLATLRRVVFTRDKTGLARLYVDGVELARRTIAGNLLNWDRDYRLVVGNTHDEERAWLGTVRRIAVYNRALRPDETDPTRPAAPALGAWPSTAALLASGGLLTADGVVGVRRYPSATLLPARLTAELTGAAGPVTAADPQPLGFAVSPYLGLSFRPAPAVTVCRLASAELLCVDPVTSQLRPTASRFFEGGGAPGDDEVIAEQATLWAREVHPLLAPESPLALLRLREIRTLPDDVEPSADTATVITTFRFALVRGLRLPAALRRPVARLRAEPADLRFREGQYGGHRLPDAIEPFELAPPQVIGAQPIYLTERPTPPPDGAAPASVVGWPWGLSALRFSVRYTQAGRGIAGRQPRAGEAAPRLWWQAIQYGVMFRSGLGDAAPAAGLPALFRAPPISSLLPVLPAPPLPPPAPPDPSEPDAARNWQPLLPGALRYLVVGTRSGVLLAVRSQLLRQHDGGLVSGSVPVQHRVPRPVPLPPNRSGATDVALRTWASFFEPERLLLVDRDPVDETFYAATATHRPQRLRLRLVTPEHGTVPVDWDGTLKFETLTEQAELPALTVTLLAGGETFGYATPGGSPGQPLTCTSPQQETIRRRLSTLAAGTEVLVQVQVVPPDAFEQLLTFRLRLASPLAPPLPLDPRTAHFEDPEYNRALATQAARAQRLIKLTKQATPGEFGLFTITLATDRRSYNPYSPLALRYDWDNAALAGTLLTVVLQRVSAQGATEDLVVAGAPGPPSPLAVGALLQVNLASLRVGQQPAGPVGTRFALQPSDKLRIRLLPSGDAAGWGAYARPPVLTEQLVEIEVDIVEDPVTPVPEAAYALLRRQEVGGRARVECVRFAWGPNASRIELVAKDDLRAGVVRRRAVFQWRDVGRAGTPAGYALQKITTTGATHIPLAWEP